MCKNRDTGGRNYFSYVQHRAEWKGKNVYTTWLQITRIFSRYARISRRYDSTREVIYDLINAYRVDHSYNLFVNYKFWQANAVEWLKN